VKTADRFVNDAPYKTFFKRYDRPLCASPAPLGAGAHMMPRKYLCRNSLHFYLQVIRHYRNWGASAAGSDWFIRTRRRRRIAKQFFDMKVEESCDASPVSGLLTLDTLERQVPVNDFSRAVNDNQIPVDPDQVFNRDGDCTEKFQL
jgi:hypothetical protein